MYDNICELEGMELVMYCKKSLVLECFQDDAKWSEVVKSIKSIKWQKKDSELNLEENNLSVDRTASTDFCFDYKDKWDQILMN